MKQLFHVLSSSFHKPLDQTEDRPIKASQLKNLHVAKKKMANSLNCGVPARLTCNGCSPIAAQMPAISATLSAISCWICALHSLASSTSFLYKSRHFVLFPAALHPFENQILQLYPILSYIPHTRISFSNKRHVVSCWLNWLLLRLLNIGTSMLEKTKKPKWLSENV